MKLKNSEGSSISTVLIEADSYAQHAIKGHLSQIPDINLVRITSEAKKALPLVRKLHPDVVVIDMQSPKINGIELTKMLTRPPVISRVLALSSIGDLQLMDETITAGAAGFLLKSDSLSLISHGIRSTHNNDALISPKLATLVLKQWSSHRSPLPELSDTERELIILVSRGLSNYEIATTICLSTNTVKNYVSKLLKRFGLTNRTSLAAQAHKWGLHDPSNLQQ